MHNATESKMSRRPVTLFTGQWADLPLAELAPKAREFGYDGLELACWGDHFNIERAATDPAYAAGQRALLAQHGLGVWAIGSHLIGQLVLDPNDERSDGWVPEEHRGDPEAKRAWAIQQMKLAPRAARNLGVNVVTGFTGSSIWRWIYPFPPVTQDQIKAGYRHFAEVWGPILDEFQANGVRFALEVHPTEIAFDLYSAHAALDAVDRHPAFGFNFDPSHLLWQGVDPAAFIREFPDRIFHVHMKDVAVMLDGKRGILASHLPFGDSRRGWDFRSLGHGHVNFKEIIRALNEIGYTGPLSVEWEDSGMDREYGARDAARFVREIDFPPSARGFEEAFGR
ncbi:MAG TPA: sugar phosphate isomerase/epimerase [Limnochordales bacterium]